MMTPDPVRADQAENPEVPGDASSKGWQRTTLQPEARRKNMAIAR